MNIPEVLRSSGQSLLGTSKRLEISQKIALLMVEHLQTSFPKFLAADSASTKSKIVGKPGREKACTQLWDRLGPLVYTLFERGPLVFRVLLDVFERFGETVV